MYKNFLFVLFVCFCQIVEAKVVIYPHIVDNELKENTLYKVSVKPVMGNDTTWKDLQVLNVGVDLDTKQTAAMAQFDMNEPVDVKIESTMTDLDDVRIRPKSRQIVWRRKSSRIIEFTINNPVKISIEFNGDIFHNLHLFVNQLETENFDITDDEKTIIWNSNTHDIFRKKCNLIYFGPGVHLPKDLPNNEIVIPENCTVYLAPGALVKARLRVDKVKNVRIVGRGYLFHPLRGIEISNSHHITVDGITVINPKHYTVFGGGSSDVIIRNIKSFSDCGWCDGIDLMCCQNWLIDDVFLRTSDDCLAFYNHRWWYWGKSKNLTVKNSILWADVAHAIQIGLHGDDLSQKGETIEKVMFKDIDVLNVDEDDDLYRGVLSISCGDKNHVKNILFENIRVEDCQEARLIDIRVNYNSKYNRAPGGKIENIVFKNISFTGNEANLSPSRIMGYDNVSDVRNVLLENICVNGNLWKNLDMLRLNEYVSNLRVR